MASRPIKHPAMPIQGSHSLKAGRSVTGSCGSGMFVLFLATVAGYFFGCKIIEYMFN